MVGRPCLFERWGRSHTLRFGLALLLGRLPRTGGYRVVAGREVYVSVLSDAGENGRQPVCRLTATTSSPCRCHQACRLRRAPAAAGLRSAGR
jgi:hypothetical protein